MGAEIRTALSTRRSTARQPRRAGDLHSWKGSHHQRRNAQRRRGRANSATAAEAGLVEKAASLWGKAGQRSLDRSALIEVAEQLTRALGQIAALPGTAALRRQQIEFQVALMTALLHVKGYAAPETEAAAERARMLIEQAEALGEPPEDRLVLFSVLFGLWVGSRVAFNGQESRGEFLLALFTAAAVPGIGVEQGILLAIALSLVRHVRHSYRPHTMVLAPNAQGRWTPTAAKPGIETEPGLIVYRFGADLFYANADRFADEALALIDGAPVPVRRFVVDTSAMTDIDYSAARTLRDFIGELTARKIGIAFGRVSPPLHADMQRHGVAVTLGEERIFSTLHEALEATRGDNAMVNLPGTKAPSG